MSQQVQMSDISLHENNEGVRSHEGKGKVSEQPPLKLKKAGDLTIGGFGNFDDFGESNPRSEFTETNDLETKWIEDELSGYRVESERFKEARWIPSNISMRNSERNDDTSPTDAFGEIQFEGYGEKKNKFVRLDENTPPQVTIELLLKVWELPKPNLLISVTGGAKDFNMKYRLRTTFHRGLMKAAQSTGGWIITGGTHAGVMKHVGNAVQEYELTSADQKKVVAVGIATWGTIYSKENLKDMACSTYQICEKLPPLKSALDPNHSHLLLVDDGKEKFGADVEFRAKLENALSKMTAVAENVSIPVVLVVVEGGPNTLKTVDESVKNGTPTVLIKGSGRVAKILAYAVQNCEVDRSSETWRGFFTEDQREDIAQIIQGEFGERLCADGQLEKHIRYVDNIIAQYQLLTVFELGSEESATEIDIALLKALMKATSSAKDKLRLSLALNRVDIAKNDIFTNEKQLRGENLDSIMMSALKLDRAQFVDLFLDYGFVIGKIITSKRLLELYKEAKKSILYDLLHKAIKTRMRTTASMHEKNLIPMVELRDIGRVMKDLLGNYYKPYYLTSYTKSIRSNSYAVNNNIDPDKECDGAQEVFLWSVLMNRLELAQILWPCTKDPLAAALVANHLFKSLLEKMVGGEMRKKCEEGALWFEEQATKVLLELYTADEKKSQKTLVRRLDKWGDSSAIHLAVRADNKNIISTIACQELLTKRWHGGLADNNILLLLLCIFCPFFIIPFIKFYEDDKSDTKAPIQKADSQDSNLNESETTWCSCEQGAKKIVKFYKAPIIIFTMNVLSYIAFLGLYSYVLLTSIKHRQTSVGEVILILWTLTLFLEEIRQAFAEDMSSLSERFQMYIEDKWNLADILMLLMFVVGMVLRFQVDHDLFIAGKYVLGFNLLIFFIRLLHIYSIHKDLGPKLVMIHRMMTDLFYFMLILAVFIGSYGIVSEALLHDNIELSWKYVLVDLFYKAYFHIYGELFLDGDDYIAPTPVRTYIVRYLLGAYMLMCNVMLLNLLIAIFSTTYQRIQDQTDEYWYWQRYNLVFEYYSRPFLPPPLIIINHIVSFIRFLCHHCCEQCSWQDISGFVKTFNDKDNNNLSEWESVIVKQYVQKMSLFCAQSPEEMLKEANEKIVDLMSKFDELQDHSRKLAEQNAVIFSALDYIIESMKEKNLASDNHIAPVIPALKKS